MIKCIKWQTIVLRNGYSENLILKDAYLTKDQLKNVVTLENDLKGMFYMLKNHIDECSVRFRLHNKYSFVTIKGKSVRYALRSYSHTI